MLTPSEVTEANRQRWTVRAAWNGSVGVFLDVVPEEKHAPRLQATAVFENAVRLGRGLSANGLSVGARPPSAQALLDADFGALGVGARTRPAHARQRPIQHDKVWSARVYPDNNIY